MKELVPNSTLNIDHLVQRFFNIFTNKGGQSPDWASIAETCLPEVLIIKKQGLSQEVYTLETFVAPRKKLLSDGSLLDFEEYELEAETKIMGNMAQRFSKYQKSGSLDGTDFVQTGYKLFQLVNTAQGWRITRLGR